MEIESEEKFLQVLKLQLPLAPDKVENKIRVI